MTRNRSHTQTDNESKDSQGLEVARAVVQRHIGSSPRRVRRAKGGLRNLVYDVDHADGGFIVRVSDSPAKLNAFRKEKRVTERVRAESIPASRVVEVGTEGNGYAYLLQTRASGTEASKHPDRGRVLFELGQYAARIHTIETVGFGAAFGWLGEEAPVRGWNEYLSDELRLEHRLSVLEQQHMLNPGQIEQVRELLRRSECEATLVRLNHGDLRLKNVIADITGSIVAIIDWEDSISFVAPHWDFSVALHDLSIDEKEQFLSGYGASAELLLRCAPLIRALNIVNYAPVVERNVKKQRLDRLDQLRTRLSGALDLYSLGH